MTRLLVESAALGYADELVCADVSVSIPDGAFTVIVGPNACGKSTLLKSLTRLLPPDSGRVLLDGRQLHGLPTKTVAREIGLLPPGPGRSRRDPRRGPRLARPLPASAAVRTVVAGG